MHRRIAAATLLAASCVAATGSPAAMPDIPVPAGSSVSVLGEQLVVNGLDARLREIRYKGSREQLVSFYKARLQRRVDAPTTVQGGKEIISGFLGPTYITVIAEDGPGGRSAARVMQTSLTPTVRRDHRSGLPPQSQIHSQVDSKDGDRVSSLVVFSNAHSIDANVDFVAQRLRSTMGLSIVSSDTHEDAGKTIRVVHLADGRGGDAVMTVTSQGASRHVVLNTLASIGGLAR
jgi:hypothetical protein